MPVHFPLNSDRRNERQPPMKEFDIYVPLFTNQGRRIARQKLTRLKKLLTNCFGGLTYFPQRNEGLWKVGRVTFRDQIVIFRVLSNNPASATKFLKQLKKRIKRDWKQNDVLIIARSVQVL